jgi:beta-glucosidase
MSGMYDYESDFAIQFSFGFGMSYTTFEYSKLELSTKKLKKGKKLSVKISVTNTGNVAGKEVVQLYTSDLFASVTPDVKRLRRFEKIDLMPGETKVVNFSLTTDDLSFINAKLQSVTEPGDFTVEIGGLKEQFEVVQ